MKKPYIKKLKYPIWFNIVFYLLTVCIPIGFIVYQGFNSKSTIFKISFTMICALLMLWIFIRKFLLTKFEENLQAKKISLEHDYQIDVGNTDKAKWLWFENEMVLTIVNMIQVILVGGLILLLAIGIETAAIKVKALSFLIAILYFIAYFIKFTVIIYKRGKDIDSEV